MHHSPHVLQGGQGGSCLGAAETAHYYQATLFTSSAGLLTKRLSLGADGALQKVPAANMKAGAAELVKVAGLRELDALMGRMSYAQAMAYGITTQARVPIVTQRHETGDGSAIARTRENFAFPAGPGFMLLDHDGRPGVSLDADALRKQLMDAVPELEGAPMLIRQSVSAGVRGPDGAVLTGHAKWHLYLAVEDARLIPAAGEALQARLWAAGLGWYEVGKSGQALARTLVDALTNQPERLDFCAPPVLSDELRQEWQPGRLYDEHAAPFDLSRITMVGEATRARAEANQAAARAAIEQQCQAQREAWAATRAAAPARRTTTKKAAVGPLPDPKGDALRAALLADGAHRFPRRPYCSDDPKRYGQRVRPLAQALTKPHIQVNLPTAQMALVFDIDRPAAAHAWEDADLPPPTWTATNPENGHAHLAWGLSAPVLMDCEDASVKALRYLAAIEACMGLRLGADKSYGGPTTKNPLHPRWIVHHPGRWLDYELGKLAEYLPELPQYRPPRRAQEQAGVGRNVRLFTELRKWACRAIRDHWSNGPEGQAGWLERCKAQAGAINDTFPPPLPWDEVCHVAKSVARWTWKRVTPEGFREWQAAQGKKGGKASGAARRVGSVTEAAPWAAEGVSRATWYRRQKSGLLVPNHVDEA